MKSVYLVYLTPLSSVPGYKFKNFIEENKLNISIARKLDKLDTLIISDELIKEYYIKKEKDIDKYYIIPYDTIVNEFSKYVSKDSKWSDIRYDNYYRNEKVKVDGYIMSEEEIKELKPDEIEKAITTRNIILEKIRNMEGIVSSKKLESEKLNGKIIVSIGLAEKLEKKIEDYYILNYICHVVTPLFIILGVAA